MADVTLTAVADLDDLVVEFESALDRMNSALDETQKESKDVGDEFQKSTKKINRSVKSTADTLKKSDLIRLFGIATLIASTKKVISLFAVQEKAENDLSAALIQRGIFTKELNVLLREQAKTIQQLSRFGDEAVLSGQALLLSLGATRENVQTLTQASVDLAAATGKSLEESVRQLSKTLGGYAGELGEVIPSLKLLSAEQLKAGEAGDAILEIFGGRARADAQSFSGQMQSLANNLGDVGEKFGEMIVKSEFFKEVLGFLEQAVNTSSKEFQALSSIFDTLVSRLNKALTALKLSKAAFEGIGLGVEVLDTLFDRATAEIFGANDQIGETAVRMQRLKERIEDVNDVLFDEFNRLIFGRTEGEVRLNKMKVRFDQERLEAIKKEKEAVQRAEEAKRIEFLRTEAARRQAQISQTVPQGAVPIAGGRDFVTFQTPTGEVLDVPVSEAVGKNTIVNINAPFIQPGGDIQDRLSQQLSDNEREGIRTGRVDNNLTNSIPDRTKPVTGAAK